MPKFKIYGADSKMKISYFMFIILIALTFAQTAISQTADDQLPSYVVRYIDASVRYRNTVREVSETLPEEINKKFLMSRHGILMNKKKGYSIINYLGIGNGLESGPKQDLVDGAYRIYKDDKIIRYVYKNAETKSKQVIMMRNRLKDAKTLNARLSHHDAHVVPVIDPSNALEGRVGRFDSSINKYSNYKVFQIVNDHEMLIQPFNEGFNGINDDGPLVWISGVRNTNLSDGDNVDLGQTDPGVLFESSTIVFECVGRHEYTTALGTVKSVVEFKQVDIGGYLEQIENALIDRDANNN